MRSFTCTFMGVILVAGTGCDILNGIFLPTTITVELVNNSPDFAVNVDLFVSDEDISSKSILTTVGDELNFVVEPGETTRFTRQCDDLRSITIDDAELDVLVGLGPEDDTGVFNEGDDFDCGSRIQFIFSHTDALIDFAIETRFN